MSIYVGALGRWFERWARRVRELPDETREFIKAECDAGDHCHCLKLTASLFMSNPNDRRALAGTTETPRRARTR